MRKGELSLKNILFNFNELQLHNLRMHRIIFNYKLSCFCFGSSNIPSHYRARTDGSVFLFYDGVSNPFPFCTVTLCTLLNFVWSVLYMVAPRVCLLYYRLLLLQKLRCIQLLVVLSELSMLITGMAST